MKTIMDINSETYNFWEKLENDFGINISSHMKNSLNANGLNNAVIFNGIEEKSINLAENFVSSKLLLRLETIAESNGQKLGTKEKLLFFGKNFASEPSHFKFTLGEKILINQIKQHVIKKGFKYFATKKRKLNKIKLTETAVGIIFGETENLEDSKEQEEKEELHVKSASHEKSISSSENCAAKLLISANKATNKELRANGVEKNSILTADMIKIDQSENGSIKGYVQCVFCKEMRKVSYKNCSGNWVMSNLINHLKKCSHLPANKKTESKEDDHLKATEKKDISKSESDLRTIGSKQDNLESNKKIDEAANVQTTNLDSPDEHVFLSDNLIRQMSLQNVKMKNTVAKNNGKITERHIRAKVQNILSDMSIEVCQIPPDGNCLFNAVCHQLYRLKIESEEHKTLMAKLRIDVVQHIKSNITKYEFIMKDRIFHKQPGIKNINQNDIEGFLEKYLSKDGHWGGNESLHALSNMNRMNIIIFNETDDPNMILKFNPEYNESIMIFLNSSRDHYESVVSVDNQVVLAIALEIIGKQTKPSFIPGMIYEVGEE